MASLDTWSTSMTSPPWRATWQTWLSIESWPLELARPLEGMWRSISPKRILLMPSGRCSGDQWHQKSLLVRRHDEGGQVCARGGSTVTLHEVPLDLLTKPPQTDEQRLEEQPGRGSKRDRADRGAPAQVSAGLARCRAATHGAFKMSITLSGLGSVGMLPVSRGCRRRPAVESCRTLVRSQYGRPRSREFAVDRP
jgi:hypothetical protein